MQVFAWLAETILWRVIACGQVCRDFSVWPASPPNLRCPATARPSTVGLAGTHSAHPPGTIVGTGSDPQGDRSCSRRRGCPRGQHRSDSCSGLRRCSVRSRYGGEHGLNRSTTRWGAAAPSAAWYGSLSAAFPPGRHTLTIRRAVPNARPGAVGVRVETPPPAQVIWEYWADDLRAWLPVR